VNQVGPAETPDVAGAYPRLSGEQVELLSRRGATRPVERSELLVGEGQRDRDFLVVLSGKVAVIEGYGTPKARLVRVHGSVYYAATFMEAVFCERQPVSIVGGGNSAGQATVFLARHAERVRLIIRHDDLNRDMSRYLVDQIERLPNVEVLCHMEVTELIGDDGRLQALGLRGTRAGERQEIPTTALFAFIGAQPCTGWLASNIALDERGYVLTGARVHTDAPQPVILETSRPGVLAVGDVRSGSIKRVASAVGEGSMAVRLIHDHLARFGHAADR
jgi:thioredoxin reductase (NADPH)